MTCADVARFFLIAALGALAFVTFLVAGTILGLMWLDTWSCDCAKRYPVGLWMLGLLGILYLISIGYEISDAPLYWGKWIRWNWATLLVGIAIIITFFWVINWWWWADWITFIIVAVIISLFLWRVGPWLEPLKR